MTNLEYISSQLGRFGMDESDLAAVLIARGIDPGAELTTEGTVEVRKAIYYEIPLLLAGMQDVSEGGYSLKWNVAGIKAWYSILAKELGLPDELSGNPKMKFVGNRW